MPDTVASPALRPRMRRRGWWLLVVGVALGHLLLMNRLAEDRLGWGADPATPRRIDVAFVRELQAAAPPVAAAPAAAPAPAAPRLPAVAEAVPVPARPASAPAEPVTRGAGPDTPPPAPPEPVHAAPPEPMPPLPPRQAAASAETPPPVTAASAAAVAAADLPALASAPDAAPKAAAAASAPRAAVAASAVAFDWPPSTRLTYNLNGDYRGPVTGSAQVEWLRQGDRYQVRMGTSIGPVLSRNIVSEGQLTAQGLVPQRFSGEQKVLFRAARRWGFSFEPEVVRLDEGPTVPTEPGVQDEASQFVQLSWLFTHQPDQLKVGQSVALPLIVSRRLNRWVYDVVGQETLNFPFGAVPTFHLKPRQAAASGDLSAEMWIAPGLQYLPVRILIRQNAESHADLTLARLPEQAAR